MLFWPALAGYVEAAVAYLGETIRPGRLAGFAIWGVRLGWLAQTALLVAQAAVSKVSRGSLGRLAEPVRLAVVGVHIFWGCRSPFRLLGLAVMPLAVALFVVAWAAGGAGSEIAAASSARSSSPSTSASRSPRSQASRSPPGLPASISGRNGGSSAARRTCSCSGRPRSGRSSR